MMKALDPSMFPSALGPFVDENPLLTHAHIKPWIIAILLQRGAVKFNEIITAVSPHCAQIDTKVGAYGELEDCDPDKTRLELFTEEVLGEMVAEGILRYNDDKDNWVLTTGPNNLHLTTIISWVSTTGGQLPAHLLLDFEK